MSFGIPASGRLSRRADPVPVVNRSLGNGSMHAEPSAPATRSSTMVRSQPVGLVGSGKVVATGLWFGRGLASCAVAGTSPAAAFTRADAGGAPSPRRASRIAADAPASRVLRRAGTRAPRAEGAVGRPFATGRRIPADHATRDRPG